MRYLLFVLAIIVAPLTLQAQTTLGGAYVELQAQGSGGTIRMGETAQLAKYRLSNRSGKNITVNRLKLRNYGTADLSESFENFVITDNNQTISAAFQADRNNVTFTFDNVVIARGEALQLSVEARLIYAQSGETVELGIRREEDLNTSIIGLDYFSLECRECESVIAQPKTLKAGGIYIRSTSPYASYRYYGSSARSVYTPSLRPRVNTISATNRYYYRPSGNQTYSPGSKDINFFSTYLNSKVDTQVEGLFLSIASGSQVSDKNGDGKTDLKDFSQSFNNFNLFVNNERVDSTDQFESYNGGSGLLFDSSFEIPPNSQILLTGRISNGAVNGDKVKFSLSRSGLIDPTYSYSGDAVETGNINGEGRSQYTSTQNQNLNITK